MKNVSKKKKIFYNQWEEQRKKKWQYIFLHGSVYWLISTAFVSLLLIINSNLKDIPISMLIPSIIILGIAGISLGLLDFNRIDSIYLELKNENDEIMKGIQKIKSGLIWNYKNLKISLDKNEMIIVQNELFWYEKENLSSEVLNESFNLIMDDFRKLQKKSDFSEFAKNKKVKIQVFDNSANKTPLIEKVIKE